MRLFVDGEEELFLEREEFFLARVLVEGELRLVDRLALLRILHHAEKLLVARLAELHLEHQAGRRLRSRRFSKASFASLARRLQSMVCFCTS